MGGRVRLTDEERKAREIMRLIEPESAHKVVGHPRYWTRQFVDLYLDRCDKLAREAPEDAARMAEHAPTLVRRVRLEDSAGSYPSESAKRSALALAYTVRDQYLSRVGREEYRVLDQAALEALFDAGVEGHALAENLKRRARSVFLEGDPLGALKMLNRVIDISGTRHPRITREALMLRGMIRHQVFNQSALEDFGMAFVLVHRLDQEDRAVAIEAALALDWDLLRFEPTSASSLPVLRMVSHVRSRLARRRRSRLKLWTFWLSGRIQFRLGIDRHAHRLLAKAKELADEIGLPIEQTMLGLDVAAAARTLDRYEEAESLARQALAQLRAREATAEIVAAVDLEPNLGGASLQTLRERCFPVLAEHVYAAN